MTDERKPPETPGMEEVSAEFVDEAGAATTEEVAAHDLMLVLRAERQGLTAELAATPEGEDAALWPRLEDVEKRILTAEPQTLLGALAQIEVLASMADEGIPAFGAELAAQLNKRVPARIEGLLARVAEDPVLVLKREWEARYQLLDEQRNDDESDEAVDPFYDRLREIEVQILHTQATTPAGIAVKLVLWARLRCYADQTPGLSWNRKPIEGEPFDLDRLPVISALNDLEHLAQGTVGPQAPAVPVIDDPLLALEQRWREAVKTHLEAGIDTEVEYGERVGEIEREIFATSAQSIAGVLVKLNIYASGQPRADTHPIDQLPPGDLDHDQAAVAGAIRDLKRMAHTTMVVETPPAEDAALFDALAEYDRLAAIEQELNRRTEVFRPGIPEAKEATEAHEAAYDEASNAWAKARDIPATTQAGLFAKLQAAIRFMADVGEDELYEAEWQAIKTDMQRIADRGPERLAGEVQS